MSKWKPIETAPKNGTWMLLFGQPENTDLLKFTKPQIHAGYYCLLDESWCVSATTWAGPFIQPTHWMPLPEAPK